MSRRIVLTLLALVLALGLAGQVLAGPISVDFLGSSFGTSSYILGMAYEDISKKYYPEIVVNARETPGLIFNLRKLLGATPEEKKKTFITSYDGQTFLAENGKPPFTQKVKVNFKNLFGAPALAVYFMTRKPEIKTMDDLVGKTVALGTKTQLGWGQHLEAYINEGAQLKGKLKVQWLGLEAALTAFRDNLIDAMPSGCYINPITKDIILAPQTQEVLAMGDKVTFLFPKDEAAAKRILAATGLEHYLTIPAGKIKYQDTPILTTVGLTYYACAPEFDEQAAYHIVRMMVQHVDKMSKYHALGKLMSKESLAYGMTKDNLHPGAYKAFLEAGLVK